MRPRTKLTFQMLFIACTILLAALLLLRASPATTQASDHSSSVSTQYYSKISDVPYCSGHALQKYDVLAPTYAPSPTPLVIYIHGGGWHTGDKNNEIVRYYGQYLAESGIAFASINYRLAPQFRYPTQNQDVSCAINDIAAQADRYNIDMDRVILLGDSAGGLLASMYTLTEKNPDITVRGVISFYGTTDFIYQLQRKTHRNSNAENYLGSTDPTLAKQASPLYQKIVTVPPFLFFNGEEDTMVTIGLARALYEKIRHIEPKSHFVTVKSANHHFDDKSTPNRATIRDMTYSFVFEQTNSSDTITETDLDALDDSDSTPIEPSGTWAYPLLLPYELLY